jgi:hypothetical protein
VCNTGRTWMPETSAARAQTAAIARMVSPASALSVRVGQVGGCLCLHRDIATCATLRTVNRCAQTSLTNKHLNKPGWGRRRISSKYFKQEVAHLCDRNLDKLTAVDTRHGDHRVKAQLERFFF